MSGACDGLRVIDFSTWMAGPLATMVLADNGADVIKVESPAGDPARALPAFQTWNRGKRAATIDLKTPHGRASALDLARTADVVVTSFRPGVAERLGIGYDDIRVVNPRAVYAAISGYGEAGARRDLAGYDALVTARSGRMMMFEGVAERAGPAYPALPCASYSAAMLTAQGVLAALHRRRVTGAGDRVAVSLLAALMPFDLIMWIGWQLRGQDLETEGVSAPMLLQKLMGERKMIEKAPPKEGAYDPTQLHRPKVRVPRPNYLTAVTKDGVWIQFANTMDHLCVAQMTALDLLDLYGEERFAKLPAIFTEDDADDLWGIVLERVRTKTWEEWSTIFARHEDLAVERVRGPLDSLRHRQIAHNGQAVAVPGFDGKPTLQPGPIALLSANAPTIGRPAPCPGEHTDAVLAEQRQVPDSGPPAVADAGAPLAGITILDFSAWIAAPLSTTMLANLGARVIKIEQVGGDMSRYSTGGLLAFPMTQGKESIALNLKSPEGLAIARKLIERSDILVHNYRAGVAARIGIDYATCRALNPRIIYLDAASYGADGPDCRKPAFFAVAAALGGNQARQVGAGHPRPGVEHGTLDELKTEAWRLLKAAEGNADPIAALGAATALLLALHARDASGEGQSLVTTMIGSTLYANSDETIDYDGRPPSPQVDEQLLGLGPAYRLYETRDGWLFVCCMRRAEWDALCDGIGRADLAPRWVDVCRAPASDAVASELESVFRTRSATEWERDLAPRGAPVAAVETRDPGRFNMEDPDMRAQGHAVQAHSPVHGAYWRHGALYRFGSGAPQAFGAWEPLGGHSRAILAQLGYAPDAIDALVDAGIVEAWAPEANE